MSFQGMIEDVPVADVIQLIHLGVHSGTLSIRSGTEEGYIGFERGRIVSAWYPGSHRLGELLVSRGEVNEATLMEGLEIQKVELPRRNIGQLLVRLGATTPETIRKAMTEEIERVVGVILGWKSGHFEFILDDLTPIIEVTRFTGAPRVDLDTQAVLMEALRRMVNESDNPSTSTDSQPALEETSDMMAELSSEDLELIPLVEEDVATLPQDQESSLPQSEPLPSVFVVEDSDPDVTGVDRPRLQLVTSDDSLCVALNALLAKSNDHIATVTLRDAGSSLLGEAPPIVVVDLRGQRNSLATLSALCRTRPRASVIAVFQGRAPLRELFGTGVLSVTSSAPETIEMCLRSVQRQRKYLVNEQAITEGIRASFARLRRIITDLRSGLLGTSVSSNLLSALAESLARGVLFVPHRERLVALGAFGQTSQGIPLAETTRGLIFPYGSSGIFAESVADMHTRRSRYDDAAFPSLFRAAVDRPKRGEVVVLPVPGSEKLVALIYLDNGTLDRTIGDIEVFELASFQLGLALENELLRRELIAKGLKVSSVHGPRATS